MIPNKYIGEFHLIKTRGFLDLVNSGKSLTLAFSYFKTLAGSRTKPSLPMARKDKTLKLNHIGILLSIEALGDS